MVNVTCVFDRNGHHPVMTETPPILIDEAAHCRYRDRAAAGYGDHDFLKRAVAERIVDRLDAVRDVLTMSSMSIVTMAFLLKCYRRILRLIG